MFLFVFFLTCFHLFADTVVYTNVSFATLVCKMREANDATLAKFFSSYIPMHVKSSSYFIRSAMLLSHIGPFVQHHIDLSFYLVFLSFYAFLVISFLIPAWKSPRFSKKKYEYVLEILLRCLSSNNKKLDIGSI